MAARNFVNGVGISLCRRMSFSITFDEWVQCSDLRLVLGTNGIVPGLASWEGVMILILLTMPHITKICENAWCILVRKLQSTTNTEKTGTTQRRNSLVTIRSGVSPIFSRVFKRWPSSLESHPLFTLSSISASQSLLTTRIYPTVVPNKGRPKGAWKRKRERERQREREGERERERCLERDRAADKSFAKCSILMAWLHPLVRRPSTLSIWVCVGGNRFETTAQVPLWPHVYMMLPMIPMIAGPKNLLLTRDELPAMPTSSARPQAPQVPAAHLEDSAWSRWHTQTRSQWFECDRVLVCYSQ